MTESNNFFELIEWFKKNVDWLNLVLIGGEADSALIDGVEKPSIDKRFADRFTELQAMVQGRSTFETKAALVASGAPPAEQLLAEVWNDENESNNGLYGWSVSSWVKSPYDMKAYTRSYTSPLFDQAAKTTLPATEIVKFDTTTVAIPECNQDIPLPKWSPSSGITGWIAGLRVNTYRDIEDVGIYVASEAVWVSEFHIKVHRRPLDFDNHNPPGDLDGDELIVEKVLPVAQGDVSSSPMYLKTGVKFLALPDYVYYITWEAFGVGGPVGCSGATQVSTEDIDKDIWPSLRGWYKTTGWSRYTADLFPIVVYESGSSKNLVNNVKQSDSLVHLVRSALGAEEEVIKSVVDANPNNSPLGDRWSGADFWRWGQVFKIAEAGRIGSIRANLNIAATASGKAPLDTSHVRVLIYRTDPELYGELTPNTMYSPGRELAYQTTLPINLTAESAWHLFPVHFDVDPKFEYGVILEGVRPDGTPGALGIRKRGEPDNIVDDRFKAMYSSYGMQKPDHASAYVAIEVVNDEPYINAEKFAALMQGIESVPVTFYQNRWSGGGWSWNIAGGGAFRRWAVGYVPDVNVKATTVTFSLNGASTSNGLRLRVYRRASGDMNERPGGANDTVVLDREFLPSEIGATPGWGEYTLDISSIDELKPANAYVFEIGLSDQAIIDGVGGLGCGTSHNVSDGDPQWKRGWYSYDDDPTNMTWGNIAASRMLAIRLDKMIYQPTVLDGNINVSAHPVITRPGEVKQTAPFQVTIGETKLVGLSGITFIPETVLTFDAPTNSKNISEQYVLTYSQESRLYYHPAARFPWTHIRNVKVMDGGSELIHGLDWDAWFDGAKLRGLKDAPDKTVTVTYDGYMARYDLVVYNPLNGGLSIVKGTDRNYDADEYMPENNTAYIPIFKAMVHGDSVEMIPLYPWEGSVLIGTEGEHHRRNKANKQAINHLLDKLNSGQDITMVGYGDSITAGSHTLSYYTYYPQDTKDRWGESYQRFGWNQRLQDFLQVRYGVNVTFHNRGIGGSSSRPEGPNGGSYPGRLEPVLDLNADLVVIAFGMNEIGSSSTVDNMVNIIKQFQARGTAVIVLGTPQVNSIGGMPLGEKWERTNDQLHQAAMVTGAAYVSISYIAHPSRLGGMGMSQMHMCNSNQFNHPGPYDLKQYGNALCEVFK